MKLSTHSHHPAYQHFAYPNKLTLTKKRRALPPHSKTPVHLKSRRSSETGLFSDSHWKEDEYTGFLAELRKEAYTELHQQMQSYNDTFVAQMRHLEEKSPNSLLVPADDSYNGKPCLEETDGQERAIQELSDMLEAGTIKDYSRLVEWQLCQNPHLVTEDQGGHGDLW
ncbi:uncharacterized protein BYT42DRAFT_559388 [Radiomyces spectabilis]|uniref:uncharacterized protein n=1 Tax=Radiomyces spectabilis TaxID=64574 RepID=UPI00221EB86E|nr:uncharacterized protein BYT42DRAFT_559388 [Radiomyces spectabilis]KAI8388229.1 hypothetical protein BYT42DRAFT_559388 [Radiomyces spectabilis]